MKHPLVGENLRFNSWVELCEYAMDIAEDEAKRRLNNELVNLICAISDELIESAEECEVN